MCTSGWLSDSLLGIRDGSEDEGRVVWRRSSGFGEREREGRGVPGGMTASV